MGAPVAGDPARVQEEAERGGTCRGGFGGFGGFGWGGGGGFREPAGMRPDQVVQSVAAGAGLLEEARIDQALQRPLGLAGRPVQHGGGQQQIELADLERILRHKNYAQARQKFCKENGELGLDRLVIVNSTGTHQWTDLSKLGVQCSKATPATP
ncbi:hypothetical protein [Streptomyces milbemycinicus]|uniref:hypothetical protein n=1 Tax=Streptomyces milbemycinicus TaxID=476552 RepID=UPI00340F2CD9